METKFGSVSRDAKKGRRSGPLLHVLIANVDQRMAEFLRVSLEKNQILVDSAADIFDALFGDSEEIYDCIVMNADPLVIREIRSAASGDHSILAIVDDATVDARVQALESGADDCLKSPFAISELVARIRALSRRAKRGVSTTSASDSLRDFEYIGDLKLVKRSDRNVALTHTEDMILGHLLENLGCVVTSSELAFRLWGLRSGDRTNLVAVHVANLRRKIDRGHNHRVIHTARGRGYFAHSRDRLGDADFADELSRVRN